MQQKYPWPLKKIVKTHTESEKFTSATSFEICFFSVRQLFQQTAVKSDEYITKYMWLLKARMQPFEGAVSKFQVIFRRSG